MSLPTFLRANAQRVQVVRDAPDDTIAYWLARLGAQLDEQTRRALAFEAYYVGKHPMQFATSKFRETFGYLFSEFADNWCSVVIDASLERLAVQGFRFGSKTTYEGDADAWAIWQANDLDADSVAAHLEAIKTGSAFVIVDGGDPPLITVESPLEVTVAFAPGSMHRRVAALKRWRDERNYLHATLYLPEGAYRFVSEDAVEKDATKIEWVPDDPARVPNPFGSIVPVLPLVNNPSMIGGGRSDLRPVLDIQNAINKLVTDMVVASEYAAFRQRWATGVEIPRDPTTGEPDQKAVGRFLSSVSRTWVVEDDKAAFGDFNVTDLGNYVRAIEMLIQHLAAQTRTPPHYLTSGLGQWPSGDSLKASEVGLVAKVKRKQLDFSDTWEEAMRLAFLAMGDNVKARATDAEVIWADPEFRSEGERVDALVKMRTLGVPLEALWARWGASPQEINRWRQMQEREAQVLGGLAASGVGVKLTGAAAELIAPPNAPKPQ